MSENRQNADDAARAEPYFGERPRPEYGEYATPQNQADAIAKALPPVSPLLTPAGRQAAVTPAAPAARRAAPVLTPSRPRRRWDLFLSIALLAYGLLTVLGGFVQYSDIPAIINQAYAAQRIGEFTSIEQAGTVGTTIMVANVVLYAITAFLTVRLLRARRLAFYVPLIGGAVAATVTVVLILTLVVNDPAFREFVASVT
ncbi:DUF6264 family protein [Marisediminicola antarctica]|uniref:Uncharacterized protein n=1 Tax=Marisediminicola antarctica TaxID=674079 RepID=A0A7L5AH78_9MICO|nr:DUF6264 family protein [Marisediminicola antarctica]QHO69376.1 hypothetical protein BHD05_06695 [Marisediminicola antarctica]